MTQISDTHTLLRGDGTSQQQRRLDALDPTFVKIDEREVEDFLVFALRLAERLKYYDLSNSAQGEEGPYNWQPFFTASTSVVIADIQTTNPLPQKRKVETALSGPDGPARLREVFDGLLEIARTIDQWDREVDPRSALRGHIGRLIEANLSTTLGRLVSYEKAALEHLDGYELEGFVDEDGNILSTRYEARGTANFGPKWNLTDPAAVAADPSLFGGYAADEDKIAAAKDRLQELFLTLYNTYVGIVQAAPRYFDASVDERSDHRPHIALFLAFLKLYVQVRDDLNRLTDEHLDFFYEQVLGLTKKSAEPDHAHLVITPAASVFAARGIDEYKITAGTAVDAGKDPTGVKRIYTVDHDLVANLAHIESLKTVLVSSQPAQTGDSTAVESIHAAPVANSADGMGGEFEDEDSPSWPTLGSTAMPHATIGFAVASRALLLQEATRQITLDLHCSHLPADLGTPGSNPFEKAFDLDLSGPEGWINRSGVTAAVTGISTEEVEGRQVRKGILRFDLTLDATEPPVTFFNAEVFGVDYGTSLPLMRVKLRAAANTGSGSYTYDILRALIIEKITVDTEVTGDGVRNLLVQNDQFVMDAGKPFQPFGPSPDVGSNFYIGSAELFEKDLNELVLHINWEGLPESFSAHYEGYYDPGEGPTRDDFKMRIELRQDKSWIPIQPSDRGNPPSTLLFPEEDIPVTLTAGDLTSQVPRKIERLEPLEADTQHGFLRLTLDPRDFFHDRYPSVLTRQALAAGKLPHQVEGAIYRSSSGLVKGTDNTSAAPGELIIPREPYTPTIKSFWLTYRGSLDSGDHSDSFAFIHLHPFENRYEKFDLDDESPHLLPQFAYEGALFLGVTSLQARQSLSILFQVAEGTADPELEKADIEWHYLASNEWKKFEEYEITSDTTNELTTSGIVTFTVPGTIDRTNTTVLPPALHWIRGSVSTNAGAVSDLIGIHTQAVRATFADQGNDPDHLITPLPAETISGLLADDAAVDSVAQPYPSFGGRLAEKSLSFYTRVSEHLRHKGRAIAQFDYERLVLEAYPDIYKVKCIRHTNNNHERAPGHVLVAVIPDFTELPAANRRTPLVTLARLDEIKTFLRGVNSPFVQAASVSPGRLHVLNPEYEEVRVSFSVKFIPSITAISFYVRELETAIVRFLSSWAFDDGGDISFGGKVYKSTILNFVEEQSYVDYVTDFTMMHQDSSADVDVIEAATPRSILVPAVDADRDITPILEPYTVMKNALDPRGIGAMTLSDDFRVSSP